MKRLFSLFLRKATILRTDTLVSSDALAFPDVVKTDVRFRESRHRLNSAKCPLMTQSGHELFEIAAMRYGQPARS
jgi:hypothetical protein